MPSAHHEVRLEHPPEVVFDFLLDGTNNPSWQRPVVEVAPPAAVPGVGTVFHQRMRHPLGFKVTADYEVTAAQRPRELVLSARGGGPIRPTLHHELTEADDGTATVLRSTVEYRPHGAARALAPVLALLHPLFAWEAGWTERLPEAIGEKSPKAG